MAFSGTAELGVLERVVVVAGVQLDGPTLETIDFVPFFTIDYFLTETAHQLNDLVLTAFRTDIVNVFIASDVGQHVVDIAFHHHASLAVHRHSLCRNKTGFAQLLPAGPVHHITLLHLRTLHAPQLKELLLVRSQLVRLDQSVLVLGRTGVVTFDVGWLTPQTVKLPALRAYLRTLSAVLAQDAQARLAETVQ